MAYGSQDRTSGFIASSLNGRVMAKFKGGTGKKHGKKKEQGEAKSDHEGRTLWEEIDRVTAANLRQKKGGKGGPKP